MLACFSFILFNFGSCSKLQYVVVQGKGQLSLLTNAKNNQDVLSQASVSKEHKRKIGLIEEYKKYFFDYFNKDVNGIYSKTTILDRKAVTYLVVASKYYEIRPKEECFWFVGCFPYLGFYDMNGAIDHAKNLEQDGYETTIRPVYAYSTLGHFEDPILSSFFVYSDQELAELIFHELFHTIFFVSSEVDLNENLANYFGKEMAWQYYKRSVSDIEESAREKEKKKSVRKFIVSFVKELEVTYEKNMAKNLTLEQVAKIRLDKMETQFLPQGQKLCKELGLEKSRCIITNQMWNNASFAGYLTYEDKMDRVDELRKRVGSASLKEFYSYIENKHKEYLDKKAKTTFSKFLFE